MMLETLNISQIPFNTIKLLINVDGVPISKSSGSQFWPILGLIMGIPNSKPFLIGIYHGTSKPDDSNSYLEDFTTDMLELLQTGISFNGVIIKVVLHGFVCDAPARAFIVLKPTAGISAIRNASNRGTLRAVLFSERKRAVER